MAAGKIAKDGKGDPRAHAPSERAEVADTNGLMGAQGADSKQPGKEVPGAGEVRQKSQDHYGVV